MRNTTKMLMLDNNRKRGGNGMRDNYPRNRGTYYPEYEMDDMYDEMEMRRRRDRRGRFTSEMEGRRGGGNRGTGRPQQIGFRDEGGYARMGGGGRGGKMEMGGMEEYEEGMDEELAEEWTSQMKNADGTKGPHWKMEQTEQLMERRKLDCDPVEFWVAMNMMYSDYSKVARAHGVNNVEFYADMAKAFLDDADAVEGKLEAYYEACVK